MRDQMRVEFETEYFERYGIKPQCWDGVDYRRTHARGAWWAWQASRAALVVELPDQAGEWYGCPSVDGYNMALDKCRTAIQSAGVNVK